MPPDRPASPSSRSWRASSASAPTAGQRSRPRSRTPANRACSSSPTASAVTSRCPRRPTRRHSSAARRRRSARSPGSARTRSRPTRCSGSTRSSRSSTAHGRPPRASSCSCGRRTRVPPTWRTSSSRAGTVSPMAAAARPSGSASPRSSRSSARRRLRPAGCRTSAPSSVPPRPSTSRACASSCRTRRFCCRAIGAQGGRVEDLAPAFAPGRAGGLVSASRSIASAHESTGGAPAAAARAEAERLREAAWSLR